MLSVMHACVKNTSCWVLFVVLVVSPLKGLPSFVLTNCLPSLTTTDISAFPVSAQMATPPWQWACRVMPLTALLCPTVLNALLSSVSSWNEQVQWMSVAVLVTFCNQKLVLSFVKHLRKLIGDVCFISYDVQRSFTCWAALRVRSGRRDKLLPSAAKCQEHHNQTSINGRTNNSEIITYKWHRVI